MVMLKGVCHVKRDLFVVILNEVYNYVVLFLKGTCLLSC